MTAEQFLEMCRNIPGAVLDKPFSGDFDSVVCRHADSRKWFALLMLRDGKYIVNLKCEPQEAELLRKLFKGVTPGYHMNKRHWNTVLLGSDLPDEELRRMTLNSFRLTG